MAEKRRRARPCPEKRDALGSISGVDQKRYRNLMVGEKVLCHWGPHEALYEGLVTRREILPGGAIVIYVLVYHVPQPLEDQVITPGADDLHALPFDGSEHCHRCAWSKLAWLAGDRQHPFTGRPSGE